jgi:predicted amidohydrolase
LSSDDKVYNSSPVFSPEGKLVALHRKVHLFDIDMSASGGIVFKESDTLTGGDRLTIVETGAKLSSITLDQNAKLTVR